MSLAVQERVWRCSKLRRNHKLLLLAFANHADDLGVCWPGPELLSTLISEELRYTKGLIAEVVKSGELYKKPGGGKGIVTVYGVTVGLPDADRARLIDVVDRTIVKSGVRYTLTAEAVNDSPNSALQNTVSPNSVLQTPQTVFYSSPAEGSNPASEPPESGQNTNPNHHGTTMGGGGGTTTSKKSKVPNGVAPHVRYLSDRGMGAAHLFADLDPEIAVKEFEALIAAKWSIPAIVNRWKVTPPTKERFFNGEDQPERPANTKSTTSRSPRPGERGYRGSR